MYMFHMHLILSTNPRDSWDTSFIFINSSYVDVNTRTCAQAEVICIEVLPSAHVPDKVAGGSRWRSCNLDLNGKGRCKPQTQE